MVIFYISIFRHVPGLLPPPHTAAPALPGGAHVNPAFFPPAGVPPGYPPPGAAISEVEFEERFLAIIFSNSTSLPGGTPAGGKNAGLTWAPPGRAGAAVCGGGNRPGTCLKIEM